MLDRPQAQNVSYTNPQHSRQQDPHTFLAHPNITVSMHTSVIESPQAMSNDQSYRPRSPDLQSTANSQQDQEQQRQPVSRPTRLPSYQIEEPSIPRGFSFSPRGSYDASPFFSQTNNQPVTNPLFSVQQPHSYSEISPPYFTPAYSLDQPQVFSPISYQDPSHRQANLDSYSRSPARFPPLPQYSDQVYQQPVDDMARLRSRNPVNYNEDHGSAQYEDPIPSYPAQHHVHQTPQQPQQMTQPPPTLQYMQAPIQMQMPMSMPLPQAPTAVLPQIDVKTKFPVARIKRIMQADEDVGKVSQATPTAVSKALELFMIALVTKGAAEAKNHNSKRVTASHLKQALLNDPQFDFLNEICEAVPDEGAKGSKGRAKSEAKSEDSDEDIGALAKKKKVGRKKKSTNDDGSD